MVLIRPRAGDFCYDAGEMQCMLEDIRECRRVGVAGVVSGVLKPDGSIDEERTLQLMQAASAPLPPKPGAPESSGPMSSPCLLFTFHRAFDLTCDLPAALRTLIRLKVPRVLTSGGCNDAIQGQSMIKVSRQGRRDARSRERSLGNIQR
jgi:copper homeostasis protein